jgi:hypothetical protein
MEKNLADLDTGPSSKKRFGAPSLSRVDLAIRFVALGQHGPRRSSHTTDRGRPILGTLV